MATPDNYAAALLDYAGTTIATLIREHVELDEKLLDIGAGWGKYRFLLPEYEMDAVDVWEPYVRKHKLDAYYDSVFICDASRFAYPHRYGAVIMGDVLEHLEVADAQAMVRAACLNADYVFIATPFEMEQHEVEGNPHEAHIQADLNRKIMDQRYPELELFDYFGRKGEHTKAIYVKRGSLL